MFNTIVIGADGHAGGMDALSLARSLAEPDTRLVAVHALPVPEFVSHATVSGFEHLVHEEASKALGEWVDDPKVEQRVVADSSPARALHSVAGQLGAELIVTGSAHHGPVGRVLLGDVSRSTIHGARCMVAVAPHDYRSTAPLIRVVGTGFQQTPEAMAAFDVAVGLAERFEAQLRVVSAANAAPPVLPYAYALDWEPLHDEMRAAARKALAEATAGLELSVVSDVVSDAASDALVALSTAADLMVVGSRGWGALKSILLGSTGYVLANQSHCPVIFVPSPAP